jgi:hypothetical protein
MLDTTSISPLKFEEAAEIFISAVAVFAGGLK